MQLEGTELKDLTLAFDSVYPHIDGFAMLVAFVNHDLDNIAPVNQVKRERIAKTLQVASTGGWVARLLDEVLGDAAKAAAPGITVVQKVRDALAERQAALAAVAGLDPLQALVVYSRPFINRDSLRRDLTRIAAHGGSCTCVVRGQPASGKSHTWYFVRNYVESMQNGGRLAKVDLSNRSPLECEPYKLMETLALKMKLSLTDLPRDTFAQDPRVCSKLVDWLIGQSRLFPRESLWWIGFDGLDRPQAAGGALELVDHLVTAVEQGELEQTRLLLLGLDQALPIDVANNVVVEPLDGITRPHVRLHLERLFAARGRPFGPGAVDPMVDFAFQGLPVPLDHANMKVFTDRLMQAIASVA